MCPLPPSPLPGSPPRLGRSRTDNPSTGLPGWGLGHRRQLTASAWEITAAKNRKAVTLRDVWDVIDTDETMEFLMVRPSPHVLAALCWAGGSADDGWRCGCGGAQGVIPEVEALVPEHKTKGGGTGAPKRKRDGAPMGASGGAGASQPGLGFAVQEGDALDADEGGGGDAVPVGEDAGDDDQVADTGAEEHGVGGAAGALQADESGVQGDDDQDAGAGVMGVDGGAGADAGAGGDT